MADCCASPNDSAAHTGKRPCPADGTECAEVSAKTITHHIKNSWQWDSKGLRYYFCDSPDCDVVYFGDDGSVILKSQLRTQVGIKEPSADAMLCYCFGITQADARREPAIREFVVTQTKLGRCACDTRNPSGRCCLKDFPRKHEG